VKGSKKKDDNDNDVLRLCREPFRCNVCGAHADFIVQLELVKDKSNYNIIASINQIPFFLCNEHQYLYRRMQNNIELKDYFAETIKENQ
jgi:hypothetical protein